MAFRAAVKSVFRIRIKDEHTVRLLTAILHWYVQLLQMCIFENHNLSAAEGEKNNHKFLLKLQKWNVSAD